jgi:hypothetical protein
MHKNQVVTAVIAELNRYHGDRGPGAWSIDDSGRCVALIYEVRLPRSLTRPPVLELYDMGLPVISKWGGGVVLDALEKRHGIVGIDAWMESDEDYLLRGFYLGSKQQKLEFWAHKMGISVELLAAQLKWGREG